jgi:hypothetical protein
MKAQRGIKCSSILSLTSALDGVGDQRHAPTALPPEKRSGTHSREAGWAPEPVWTGAENLALSGFDPRTVQPVPILYTAELSGTSCVFTVY